jgi:sulfur relay (sulfurtransferase) DsrF/TusC family protein/sulfur relay (sulfurtransferase) complex TusBCD TusD component (DsrE family)
MKEYCVYINCSSTTTVFHGIIQRVITLLNNGERISGVFLHGQSVDVIFKELRGQWVDEWLELSNRYDITLWLCSNAMSSRQINNKISPPFRIGGLGELIELESKSNAMITHRYDGVMSGVEEYQCHSINDQKTCLFIFSQSPYQSTLTQSGIENLFAHASLGRDCTVLILDAVEEILSEDEAPEGFKHVLKQFNALPLYDVTQLYTCAHEALNNELFEVVSAATASDMIHAADFKFWY